MKVGQRRRGRRKGRPEAAAEGERATGVRPLSGPTGITALVNGKRKRGATAPPAKQATQRRRAWTASTRGGRRPPQEGNGKRLCGPLRGRHREAQQLFYGGAPAPHTGKRGNRVGAAHAAIGQAEDGSPGGVGSVQLFAAGSALHCRRELTFPSPLLRFAGGLATSGTVAVSELLRHGGRSPPLPGVIPPPLAPPSPLRSGA